MISREEVLKQMGITTEIIKKEKRKEDKTIKKHLKDIEKYILEASKDGGRHLTYYMLPNTQTKQIIQTLEEAGYKITIEEYFRDVKNCDMIMGVFIKW